MNEVKRILDQMDRAFTGDAWHGPPLMQLLNGVSAEDASKHPVRGAHSIWEIVHHISAWNSVVNRRLGGEDVTITHEHDWPPVWEVNEVAWKHALDALSESRARLRKSVAARSDRPASSPAAPPDRPAITGPSRGPAARRAPTRGTLLTASRACLTSPTGNPFTRNPFNCAIKR